MADCIWTPISGVLYLGEGFDDLRFHTLVIVLPVSWWRILAQYAGRLHGLHESRGINALDKPAGIEGIYQKGPAVSVLYLSGFALFQNYTPAHTSKEVFIMKSKELISAALAYLLVVCLSGPSAAEKSADEVARELANPNNSLASLTFKNQFRWYTGDLPGAEDQNNYTLLFQPVFPFSLQPAPGGGKANLFIRPAIPLLVEQPVFDVHDLDFRGVTALGDIGFDIGYGVTEKNGLLWALGMVGTIPTATDSDVAGKQLRLGPEALIAKFEKWGVYGIFPSHQWNAGGWGDTSFSTSQLQVFLKFLPGGGWSIGSTPIMNYDWRNDEWTIPLNLSIGKTHMFGNLPVKFEVETNYYVMQPDLFGPQWMVGFNITPVVPNIIEGWIRGN